MSIIIKNKILQVAINPFGAELTHLLKNEHNYIWTIDKRFWNKTSPILFPIVGSLKNDNYQYKNKTYQLLRHGFARDFMFSVTSKSEDSVVFLLTESTETLNIYPFNFTLEVGYAIKDASLIVTYTVTNTGKEAMPFSIGAHPAFALRSKIEDYDLVFEKEEDLYAQNLDNNLFSGESTLIETNNKKLRLKTSLFENDALVFKNLQSKIITILEHNQPYLKMDFSDFDHFGIWTKTNAPFICLEPWLGYADNITSNDNLFEKEAIQILESNCQFSAHFSITV